MSIANEVRRFNIDMKPLVSMQTLGRNANDAEAEAESVAWDLSHLLDMVRLSDNEDELKQLSEDLSRLMKRYDIWFSRDVDFVRD